MTRHDASWFPFALFLLTGSTGCNSCEKDKPYVPYTIDPSATAADTSSMVDSLSPPPEEKKVKSFAPLLSRRVDGPTAKTPAGNITAPGGGQIEWLLESDVTADGKPDAVAWVRSKDGSGGELVHFSAAREGGPLVARTLVPLPADLTLRSGCKASTDLRQVGPRTVAMSLRRTCMEEGSETITEWITAVIPMRDPAVRLALLIDQPSGGERLEVTFDGQDRDGDQFDDLLAAIRLTGAPKTFEENTSEDVFVSLRYFDRPAGLSRDPHEPSSSFASLAKRLDRVAKGSQRDSVWPSARASRRIHQMLCAESGHARVYVGGAPLQCGAVDAMHRIAEAELEAALGAKDLLSALGSYDRLRSQGASAKDTDAAQKRIEKAAPRRDLQAYHLPFGPSVDESGGTWGPLAFHEDGTLLIRTDTSVMRFDAKQRVALPNPPSGPMAPWAMGVEGPGDVAFDGIVDPCDGGLLRARMRRGGASTQEPIPLDSLVLRGCKGAAPRPVSARPVLFTESGLNLLVAGGPIWLATNGSKTKRQVPDQGKGPLGGPRSPDGKHLAHATSLGVLVLGADGQGQLWRTESMASGYEKLAACTVSNGATAAACIEGSLTRVFVTGP